MPPAPAPSVIVWLLLLILVQSAGAVLTVTMWPAGEPTNTLWFGLCVAGYPFMAWALLLCGRLGYGYTRRNQAIAMNRVSDAAEQTCHDVASRPLAVLGYAWCFSADPTENSFDGLRDGTTQLKSRLSAAVADTEVHARWIDIPGRRFNPGNELSEKVRHETVCTWMLARLLDPIVPQLSALAPVAKVQVELRVNSRAKPDFIEAGIRRELAHRAPGLGFEVVPGGNAIPLFRADAWHDARHAGNAHLLIAIELLDVISATLSDGVAETGVALLVGPPRLASSASSKLSLHRPAKGACDVGGATVALAARWGRIRIDRLKAGWTHGLSTDRSALIRRTVSVPDDLHWCELEASVGNCGGAGAWLAVALAAEGARTTDEPQLVLCGHGEELTALVCRTQT